MDLIEERGDAFVIDTTWKFSSLPAGFLPRLEPFEWNKELPDLDYGTFEDPFKIPSELESDLLRLGTLELRQLEVIKSIDVSASSSEDEYHDGSEGYAKDVSEEADDISHIWQLEDIWRVDEKTSRLTSWDTFLDHNFPQPCSAYISESGPQGYDAILEVQGKGIHETGAGRVAEVDAFLAALYQLGLGRNSIFFRYDEDSKTFVKQAEDVRVSGVSLTAMESVVEELIRYGTGMKRASTFVEETAVLNDCPSALISLASAVSIALYGMEAQLGIQSQSSLSLLQIHNLFRGSSALIQCLDGLVEATKTGGSDESIISTLFERSEELSMRFEWLRDVLHEIIDHVAGPWLCFVEEWIGLRKDSTLLLEGDGSGHSFVGVQRNSSVNEFGVRCDAIDYFYRPERMPSFMAAEHTHTIFESGKSLRLLKEHHPEHPIVNESVLQASAAPPSRIAMSWEEIELIQIQAHDYEHRLRTAILEFNQDAEVQDHSVVEKPKQNSIDFKGQPLTLLDLDSADILDKSLANDSPMSSDRLYKLLQASKCCCLEPVSTSTLPFGPPLSSSIFLSLSPIISSQARLINFSYLRLLLREQKLRSHLALQWRFQLFGDGIFASRLSQALFDPEQESSERKSQGTGSGISTGLRLGSRDSWPPASSELRLVLMGLLSESYSSNTSGLEEMPPTRDNELPGGLSFAIRELSEEELEKCNDPDSIEALDFLRLQYKPPRALEAVITQSSLHKYDRLFKHLLRLIRMQLVVKGIIRHATSRSSHSQESRSPTQRFRIEAYHFISTLYDYSFGVGIGVAWQRFESMLASLEKCVLKGDIDSSTNYAKGLHRLRDFHEDTLDHIIHSLFLSKRHAQARQLLDNIFGTVLAFARLIRDQARCIDVESILTLREKFRKQVGMFIRFLRGLDDGKSSKRQREPQDHGLFGDFGAAGAAPDVFEQLLVRLEMTDYY